MISRTEPEAPPWRWGWQLLLFYVLLVIGLAPLLGIAEALGLLTDGPATSWQKGIATTALYGVAVGVVVLITWFAQRTFRKRSLEELGLELENRSLRKVGLGLMTGLLMIGVSVSLSWLAGFYDGVGFVWDVRPLEMVTLTSVLEGAAAFLFIGVVEEIAFRGWLLRVIADRWNLIAGIGVSSIAFVIAHLPGGSPDFPAYYAVASLLVAGLAFCWVYLRSGSLWLAIGLHMGWNFAISLLGALGASGRDAILVISRVSGPPILRGPDGPGAGVFDLLGLVVALTLLRLAVLKNSARGRM